MPRMKIDVASLTVVSFPTTAVAAGAEALSDSWLDTRLDCSSKCREPTNIYQAC
ncbi:MAG TPA: hypothetical protein VFJ16_25950 [Longimicrobium sp.]|nr:hypothetical protein [Longimicrobium sp.]